MTRSIAIVDDDRLSRELLRRALASARGVGLKKELPNGAVAVEELPVLKPDVVVLDVRMPVMDGLESLHRVRDQLPAARIILFTGYGTSDLLHHAISGRANGFVCKQWGMSALLAAVRRATPDGFYVPRNTVFPPEVKLPVPLARLTPRTIAQAALPVAPFLTVRERRLLRLLADGRSIKAIASELGLAGQSVSNLLNRLYRRWHCQNSTQLVAMTLRLGLLNEPAGTEE